jgi:hypothetical protein
MRLDPTLRRFGVLTLSYVMKRLLALNSDISFGIFNHVMQGGSTQTRVGSIGQFSKLMLCTLETRAEFDDDDA